MDQRLVQTAVLEGPDSLEPVLMPMAYEVAMGLRLTHHGKTFWCGTWLGGCGSQIMTKIGRRRVPHFAHYPEMAGRCRRVNLGENSADHLFIHKDLKTWLGRQGIAVQTPRLLGDIKQRGSCSGLLLHTRDAKRTIAVVLDDRDAGEWKRFYEEFRESGKPVDWLYSPTSFKGRALAGGQGTGLLAMCQYVNGERHLRIGARTAGGRINWADLADCKITVTGIQHPDVPRAKPPSSSPRTRDRAEMNGTGGQAAPEKQRVGPRQRALSSDNAENQSAVVHTLGQNLEKEAEAGRCLDAAFAALLNGDIALAKAHHGRAARLVSSVQKPTADLQRRLRSCVSQIRDFERPRTRPHQLPSAGLGAKPRISNSPKRTDRQPKRSTGGSGRLQGDLWLSVQVSAMMKRIHSGKQGRALRRSLKELIAELPSNKFVGERRIFEEHLDKLERSALSKSKSPAGGAASRKAATLASSPVRCSCGWEGQGYKFDLHKTWLGNREKQHVRLS